MRGKAFVRASGSSAVIRRSENARIVDSFESKLPASVTPRSRVAPVRPRCPETLVLGSSNWPMCVLAPQTCAAVHGRAQKGCCLFVMISMPPCIETAHSLCRTGLCGPSKVFRVFVVKSGFPGLLVSAETRKMRAVAQKLCRVWLHISFCALAGGLWVRQFCTLLLMTWWINVVFYAFLETKSNQNQNRHGTARHVDGSAGRCVCTLDAFLYALA